MESNKISWKAARVNVDMTQEQVAETLGLSKGTIRSYEKYRTFPDIDIAQKLAALYGRNIDEIKLN